MIGSCGGGGRLCNEGGSMGMGSLSEVGGVKIGLQGNLAL